MISNERYTDLEKRVSQFRTMALPGQPMVQHMGTSYLVSDLWFEVRRLRAQLHELVAAARPFAMQPLHDSNPRKDSTSKWTVLNVHKQQLTELQELIQQLDTEQT